MKKYKSKIGPGIVSSIAIVLGGIGVIMIVNHLWHGFAVILAVAVFVTYMFTSIYYIIAGNKLTVRCGFMFNSTIQIDKIKKIVETNNPISSPAASLDRLAIYYNKHDSVMVSPKDKMSFISELKEINPSIVVILKNDEKQRHKVI